MTYGPSGYGYQSPPPEKSPWSSPAVIVAIVAGVLLVILGVLAAFLFIPDSDDDTSTASSKTPAPTTVTHTAQPTVTSTVTNSPPATTTYTPPITTRANPTVSGADWQGFTDGPRCNDSADPAVAIGETDRSRVVICRVGAAGGLYYKGYADGKAVEVQFPQQSGNSFIATNGSVTYTVNPSALVIADGGAVLATEPMLAYWSQ